MEVETHNNYIGGRWAPSRGGSTYTITNPASKCQALGEFQSSTEADARDAVSAASAALGDRIAPRPGRRDSLGVTRRSRVSRGAGSAASEPLQAADPCVEVGALQPDGPQADVRGHLRAYGSLQPFVSWDLLDYPFGRGAMLPIVDEFRGIHAVGDFLQLSNSSPGTVTELGEPCHADEQVCFELV